MSAAEDRGRAFLAAYADDLAARLAGRARDDDGPGAGLAAEHAATLAEIAHLDELRTQARERRWTSRPG